MKASSLIMIQRSERFQIAHLHQRSPTTSLACTHECSLYRRLVRTEATGYLIRISAALFRFRHARFHLVRTSRMSRIAPRTCRHVEALSIAPHAFSYIASRSLFYFISAFTFVRAGATLRPRRWRLKPTWSCRLREFTSRSRYAA